MEVENKRLNYIALLQVIGPILVIIGHMTNGLPMSELQSTIKNFIYVFHMPLFFFISGYLFSYKKGVNKGEYLNFIKKKFWRLMFPYIILNLLFFIPKVILSSYLVDEVEFSLTYLLNIMLTPKLNVWGHTWFLFALFIIYLLSPVWTFIVKRDNKWIWISSVIIGIILYNLPVKTVFLTLNDLCRNMLFFLIGMLIYKVPKEYLKSKINNIWYIIFVVCIFVLFIIFNENNNIKILEMILCTLQILTLFLTSIKFYNENSKIEYLAKRSFSIYILHWPFMLIAQIIFYKILGINSIIVSIIMGIIGFTMPILSITIIERIKILKKSRLLHYLIGV